MSRPRVALLRSFALLALLAGLSGCFLFQRSSPMTNVRELLRVDYEVRQGKSQTYAAFLGEHCGDKIEIVVRGSVLTITAPPDIQQIVSDFMALNLGVTGTPVPNGSGANGSSRSSAADSVGPPLPSSVPRASP